MLDAERRDPDANISGFADTPCGGVAPLLQTVGYDTIEWPTQYDGVAASARGIYRSQPDGIDLDRC